MPPADHEYSTRGVIERLAGRDDDRIMILHETIPDFVGIDGEAAPMHAMVMPFALAPGVSLGGAGVGAKLSFTFEVRWSGGEPLLITKLKQLPADTNLEVGD